MSFDTLAFFLFFLVVCALFRTRINPGWLLLCASILYYAFAGPRDSTLFVVVLAVNYLLSLRVARSKAAFISAIVFNLGVLAYFKYRGLILETVDVAGSFEGAILIPLGISFYTFQLIAYLSDIRRGSIETETAPSNFLLFVGFFPQLVAGPIVRGHILLPQVKRLFQDRSKYRGLISLGLGLCLLGVFKKFGLSDSIAPFVDDIFRKGPADTATAWYGAWLFGFQIYFDFSGYSDMAIGMAWLLGIRLPLNFFTPYLATSPREFWQRWHITLSTWIRDYLYVPLGGSHKGNRLRQITVLILVMGLAGLWHGANMTFVVWGLAWGVLIAVWRSSFGNLLKDRAILGWAITMAAVFSLWVVFRAPDIDFAGHYLAQMWGLPWLTNDQPAGSAQYFNSPSQTILLALGALSLMGLHKLESFTHGKAALLKLRRYDGPFLNGLLLGLIALIVLMPKTALNPFIYFRF